MRSRRFSMSLWNWRLVSVTTSGSASLKKPPGCASTVWLTRVPPATDSVVVVTVIGKGFVVVETIFRLGSNAVYSKVPSIFRPAALPTESHVVPTPIGPSEVFFGGSAAPEDHFDPLEKSLRTAKTSSTGRLIVVPTSNLAMGRALHRPEAGRGTLPLAQGRMRR